MQRYDIVIVGAGITGCAIARQLARYDASIAVIEAANDIACGTTKANGGLVHAGYDPAPGTCKASVNARGCALYGQWSRELGFGFNRTGSMVLGFSETDREHLEHLLENGRANGVPDLRIIQGDEIREREPRANADATCALWCPSTGYVDPFEVAIAAAENAAANGVEFHRGARLDGVDRDDGGRFILHTEAGDFSAKTLINAAGNGCGEVSRMAGGEPFEMVWRQGNIAVLDHEETPLMPLYPIPTPRVERRDRHRHRSRQHRHHRDRRDPRGGRHRHLRRRRERAAGGRAQARPRPRYAPGGAHVRRRACGDQGAQRLLHRALQVRTRPLPGRGYPIAQPWPAPRR